MTSQKGLRPIEGERKYNTLKNLIYIKHNMKLKRTMDRKDSREMELGNIQDWQK